ncbi:MAG: hypothetical protein R2748_33420 [Bryobacterales bacterium]
MKSKPSALDQPGFESVADADAGQQFALADALAEFGCLVHEGQLQDTAGVKGEETACFRMRHGESGQLKGGPTTTSPG